MPAGCGRKQEGERWGGEVEERKVGGGVKKRVGVREGRYRGMELKW